MKRISTTPQRIILFGGGFNPVHLGHKAVAQCVMEQVEHPVGTKLFFVPSYTDMFNEKEFISGYVRADMIEQMIMYELDSQFYVSTFDIELKNTEGTYTFLQRLKEVYLPAQPEFVLVIGVDQANSITKWANYERLVKEFMFIIVTRWPNIDEPPQIGNLFQNAYFIPYKILEPYLKGLSGKTVSSTLVRKDINKYKHFLPKSVFNYIQERGLYNV